MRLLVVTPEYLPTAGGGIVTFYRHLLPVLARAGARVTVLVGSAVSQPGGRAVQDGIEVVGLEAARFAAWRARLPQWAIAPHVGRHLAAAWALREQAASLGEFDAVEAADWGLLAVPFVLDPLAPVQVRCHGSAGQIARHEGDPALAPLDALLLAIERRAFAQAAAVASYGAPNAGQWRAWLGREVAHREPALPLPAMRASADAPHWLVLARVQRWKGPYVLADALARLPSPPPVRWVGRDVPDALAGAASTRAALGAAHPAWSRQVAHADTVDAGTAQAWLCTARGVLVPSTWDVFNFAGAEAMACGAVVVASEGAGIAQWIDDGVDGFRVPAGDAGALAGALREAQALDAAARRRIGEAARAKVASRADPDRVAALEWQALRVLAPTPRVEDPLDDLLRPAAGSARIDALLAQHPLRALAGHLGRRLRDKVRGR